jgi:hypothetical protein
LASEETSFATQSLLYFAVAGDPGGVAEDLRKKGILVVFKDATVLLPSCLRSPFR